MPRGKRAQETPTSTPEHGHNGASPVNFVERIERLKGELLSERSAYMLKCKAVRGNIDAVLDEAKEAGLARRSLKAVVKARELEARADAVREGLEGDDLQGYDTIRVALGDFASTPLGQAALGETGDRPFASA